MEPQRMEPQRPLLIVADPALDPDHMLFENIDTSDLPRFSIGEVSKFFFGRSPSWMRAQEANGYFSTEEYQFIPRRKVAKNARYFCLADVEIIAHALATHGIISGTRLRTVVTLLRGQGQLWGYLA